jgi:hypothetical protein
MNVSELPYYSNHCNDLKSDREIGQYWERQFCLMAADHDKSFTPMQLGRDKSITAFQRDRHDWSIFTLPDVTIWTAPGEHHEIKHKNPFNDFRHGPSYGLEVYRFMALLWFANETGQRIMYTIHDHDKAGGKHNRTNHIDHWKTANIVDLNEKWHTRRPTQSWVNGQPKKVDTYYWSVDLWKPLFSFWDNEKASQQAA